MRGIDLQAEITLGPRAGCSFDKGGRQARSAHSTPAGSASSGRREASGASTPTLLSSALLASISHDFQTPLATIIGSASTLRDFASSLDDEAKHGLLDAIVEESERLDRFIARVLTMTRLECGGLAPDFAFVDISEIIASALHRAARILGGHKVTMIQAEGLPLLWLDAVLCEQALFNLLDNAARYAPRGSTVTIRTQRRGGHVRLLLLDEGDGIRAGEEERIFGRFERVCDKRATPGTGLGLAISRGFVEAMDGTMKAANRTDRSGERRI